MEIIVDSFSVAMFDSETRSERWYTSTIQHPKGSTLSDEEFPSGDVSTLIPLLWWHTFLKERFLEDLLIEEAIDVRPILSRFQDRCVLTGVSIDEELDRFEVG